MGDYTEGDMIVKTEQGKKIEKLKEQMRHQAEAYAQWRESADNEKITQTADRNRYVNIAISTGSIAKDVLEAFDYLEKQAFPSQEDKISVSNKADKLWTTENPVTTGLEIKEDGMVKMAKMA